jgi:hypothetical protein
MGMMKHYQMFLIEKGYLEQIESPNGDELTYTTKHPGDSKALEEFQNEQRKERINERTPPRSI